MTTYVERHCTFLQAVDAACKAYGGGQQFGVPNRLKILEQWTKLVVFHTSNEVPKRMQSATTLIDVTQSPPSKR